jgi:hypothetical protein
LRRCVGEEDVPFLGLDIPFEANFLEEDLHEEALAGEDNALVSSRGMDVVGRLGEQCAERGRVSPNSSSMWRT